MSFLSNLAKSVGSKSSDDDGKGSDLFGSAKIVAEAAQAQFSGQSDKYDKGQVAGAAADILDAASEYGKLDQSQGVGKYVEQAETYLREYDTPPPKPAADEPAKTDEPAAEPKPTTEGADEITKQVGDSTIDEPKKIEEETKPVDEPKPTTDEETTTTADEAKAVVEPTATPSTETEEAPKPDKTETGSTDYAKVAEGLLNKASSEGEGEKSASDYVKIAEGFLGQAEGDGEKKEAESGGIGGALKAAGGFFNK